MLHLDLMQLGNPARFQELCFRLARRVYPDAIPIAFAAWDGGRDIVRMAHPDDSSDRRDIVWQAKFTKSLGAATRRSVKQSIASLRALEQQPAYDWVLCLPVDPTGVFLDWLKSEVPATWKIDVWGVTVILEMLEKNPDITEQFFYPIYEELRQHFSVDRLQLERLALDPACEWAQPDSQTLTFSSNDVESPDLVMDLIVRNSGRADAVMLAIDVAVFDHCVNVHGLPGDGLLFPQITYDVSIKGGTPGSYRAVCEPPLVVRAESVERFKIRLSDTGYAWNGTAQITLDYGAGKRLRLPSLRLYT